jgi:bis(5'-nucleosyl)-tetraphosphatase (symmetrical)
MPTYAIGDVQGCFAELEALLAAFRFDRRRDRLWFVGDLVNRGPRSLEVLRFVRGLGSSAVTVLGNHDLHLIAVAYGFARQREDDTLAAVLGAPDCGELIDWLRQLPMILVEREFVLVHAGLLPQWDVATTQALAREVEAALRGPEHRRFLSELYGSMPDRWRDDLRGIDRLRVIVNAWFQAPGRKSGGHTVIYGHWSAMGLRLAPNLVGLDSGCVWGGRLSALRLEDRTLFQAPCAASAERAPQAP